MTVADSEGPARKNKINNGENRTTCLKNPEILIAEAIVPAFNCLTGGDFKIPLLQEFPNLSQTYSEVH